jgi:hypothetical protein
LQVANLIGINLFTSSLELAKFSTWSRFKNRPPQKTIFWGHFFHRYIKFCIHLKKKKCVGPQLGHISQNHLVALSGTKKRTTSFSLFSEFFKYIFHYTIGVRKSRVARWFIFKPNIPIWVNFRVSCMYWMMLVYFMTIWSIFQVYLVYYMVYYIWYIIFHGYFGIFSPFWWNCTTKNLATLWKSTRKLFDVGHKLAQNFLPIFLMSLRPVFTTWVRP